MKTSSAKAKGRRAAQAVADSLQYSLGLAKDDVRVCPSSVNGEDIQLSSHARLQFPYSIEVKNTERLQIWKSLKQAEVNSGPNESLLIFTRNREKLYVCLDWSKFLELIKEAV